MKEEKRGQCKFSAGLGPRLMQKSYTDPIYWLPISPTAQGTLEKSSPQRDENPWCDIPEGSLDDGFLSEHGNGGVARLDDIDGQCVKLGRRKLVRGNLKKLDILVGGARCFQKRQFTGLNGHCEETFGPSERIVRSLYLAFKELATVASNVARPVPMVTRMGIPAMLLARNQKVEIALPRSLNTAE